MKDYPFTVEYDKVLDKDIDKYFKSAYDINRKFFNIDLPPFKIKIWYDRKKFNQHLKFPKDSKFHANSGMKSHQPMDVMSPTMLKYEMKDPEFSSEYLKMLAKHEMCHRFLYAKYKKILYPCWINEGMSCIVAEQLEFLEPEKNKKIMPINKIHYINDWFKNHNYWQAHSMTKYLRDTYGKIKMHNLFELLNEGENYKIFSEKFNKIYNITPEYFENEWSNQL